MLFLIISNIDIVTVPKDYNRSKAVHPWSDVPIKEVYKENDMNELLKRQQRLNELADSEEYGSVVFEVIKIHVDQVKDRLPIYIADRVTGWPRLLTAIAQLKSDNSNMKHEIERQSGRIKKLQERLAHHMDNPT